MPKLVYAREPMESRFWTKVEKTDRCWIWKAAIVRGYGYFRVKDKLIRAHRFAYELLIGPIPDGLGLDHLCRTRACVRPSHLEPVSCAENIARGETGLMRGAQQRAKTHCPQGHTYDLFNTYISPKGTRTCRQCRAL